MSKFLVCIETDHTDPEDAMRSIINNLKKAGYDFIDYESEDNGYTVYDGYEHNYLSKGVIEMKEPEVVGPTYGPGAA